MGIIALSDEVLYKITDRLFNMGREQGLIDAGVKPKFISQNKAHKLYGRGNVDKWVASGLVTKFKDADGKKSSSVRFEVMQLEQAAFRCNVLEGISPMAEEEMRTIKKME